MSTAKTSLKLKMALMSTGLVTPVDGSEHLRNFHVLCRQVPGQEKTWLQVVESILKIPPIDNVEFFLARRYLLKDEKLAFGWYVGVHAKTVKDLDYAVAALELELGMFKPSLTRPAPEHAPPADPDPAPAYRRPLAPGQHPSHVQRNRQPTAGELIPSSGQVAPNGFSPRLTTVKSSYDAKGRQEIVQEMPLPHVHSEMNRPNSKGRGAKPLAGD